MMIEPRRTVKVFYSYAREDIEWLKRLSSHLQVFKWQGRITEWDDRAIQAGTSWKKEIDHHLSTSDIIFLLISEHYLGSQFCSTWEMEPALAQHEAGKARTIPILLSPVYWKATPLRKLQILPGNEIPITRWNNSDEALTSITEEIGYIIDEMLT